LTPGCIAGIYPHILKTKCYCTSLRIAARKVTALYDAALAPVGVNVAQFGMLRRIDRAGEVSITDLARLCALDRSTTGRNVKVLERMGMVKTLPGQDQREASISLSRSGRRALAEGDRHWLSAQAQIEAKLGANRASALLDLAAEL
jgi:DNA-binding MarR family transcriptional regulator